MLVGQCPGEVEIKRRRPFVGPAGVELDRLLELANITRSECRIVNIMKCGLVGSDPRKKEVECCQQHLKDEIASYKPKLIMPMGAYAWNFFGFNIPISVAHGKLFTGERFQRAYDLLPTVLGST